MEGFKQLVVGSLPTAESAEVCPGGYLVSYQYPDLAGTRVDKSWAYFILQMFSCLVFVT